MYHMVYHMSCVPHHEPYDLSIYCKRSKILQSLYLAKLGHLNFL